MRIVETFSVAKAAGRVNEDAIFVGDAFVAVLDGASAKAPTLGLTPGSAAVQVLSDTLARVNDDSARVAVDQLTVALRELSPPAIGDVSAGMLLFSRRFRQVWAIGDGWVLIDGRKRRLQHQAETSAAMARSALLHALLASGRTVADLRNPPDVGREVILPLLEAERHLRNVDLPGRLYWGGLDGTHVPDRHIVRIDVPRDAHRLVLASDGYTHIGMSLMESEQLLARRIARDPLLIGRRPQTKGVMNGDDSFDDRTWVEIAL